MEIRWSEFDALLSPCGLYRYWLTRIWDRSKPVLVVVMVNPSKADHRVNDPTISRLIAFAKRWGYGGFLVVNLNALRSSDPAELRRAADPIGPDNSMHLAAALDRGGPVLVAWGNDGIFLDGDKRFLRMASARGVQLLCLGTTSGGHPKHPQARGKHRVPDDFEPVPFTIGGAQ